VYQSGFVFFLIAFTFGKIFCISFHLKNSQMVDFSFALGADSLCSSLCRLAQTNIFQLLKNPENVEQ